MADQGDGAIGPHPQGLPLAVLTVTRVLHRNEVQVFVDVTGPEGGDVELVEALGMLEVAKDILLHGQDER